MLHKTKDLAGYTLSCIDGDIGHVKEFFFDDHHWAIRYLVADTGNWLITRQVLISPLALSLVVPENKHIVVNLTKKEIEESPPHYTDKPVSRQFEESFYSHHKWPVYWDGPNMWGELPDISKNERTKHKHTQAKSSWDLNLRSTQDMYGYSLSAIDGEIGQIEDFLVDDSNWAIRYLIIGTLDWLPGKTVLISPLWIENIIWSENRIVTNLTKEAIKNSPEYPPKELVTRNYEEGLYKHYKYTGYWDES